MHVKLSIKKEIKYNKHITCHLSQDSMAQIISNYEGNRYKDTHQEVITWKRLYTSMNKTKDKRNGVKAKTTKRTIAEWNDHEREHNIRIKEKREHK